MTTLHLHTVIKAPCHIVFDTARNIDMHQQSASKTKEKAIAGKTSGLIELGETVTWKGKHFGFYIKHQSIISKMKYPSLFVDEQLKGHFKTFKHTHMFEEQNGITIMQDILEYETPYGIFGKLFDKLFLKKHLINFIIYRNAFLKDASEKRTKELF